MHKNSGKYVLQYNAAIIIGGKIMLFIEAYAGDMGERGGLTMAVFIGL